MEIGSFEGTCIKCDGGGEVLLCDEMGCPVVLHEKCLGSEPVFDDAGEFYCPYCRYKRAIARTRGLRGKAMETKKKLTSCLDPEEVYGCKGKGKGKETSAEGPNVSVPEASQIGGEENGANHDQHREPTRDPMCFGGKRKRVLWTAEEEEMLEEGVNTISSNINKNIPWIKVLEFGSHVFHPSRNPTDLKDKWRTMNKESN